MKSSRFFATLLAVLVVASLSPAAAKRAYHEADINLDISRQVYDLLDRADVHVWLTRRTDRAVSLPARAAMANGLGVDAFVSIHNNAASRRSAAGTIVFHSIRKDGSRDLGDAIRDELRDEVGGGRRYDLRTRRGCCGDYYFMLREPRMAAALVEGAFLTNPEEGSKLARSASFRAAMARGIAQGVLDYQRSLATGRAPRLDPGSRIGGPLPVPQAGRARTLSARRVSLAWELDGLATGFRIYRNGRLIVQRDIGPAAIGTTKRARLTDIWAAPGQRYTYEVRAYEKLATGAYLESDPLLLRARTPAIRVLLDPGHGGRDPGAISRH